MFDSASAAAARPPRRSVDSRREPWPDATPIVGAHGRSTPVRRSSAGATTTGRPSTGPRACGRSPSAARCCSRAPRRRSSKASLPDGTELRVPAQRAAARHRRARGDPRAGRPPPRAACRRRQPSPRCCRPRSPLPLPSRCRACSSGAATSPRSSTRRATVPRRGAVETVLLGGEPGAGKTSIAAAVARVAHDAGLDGAVRLVRRARQHPVRAVPRGDRAVRRAARRCRCWPSTSRATAARSPASLRTSRAASACCRSLRPSIPRRADGFSSRRSPTSCGAPRGIDRSCSCSTTSSGPIATRCCSCTGSRACRDSGPLVLLGTYRSTDADVPAVRDVLAQLRALPSVTRSPCRRSELRRRSSTLLEAAAGHELGEDGHGGRGVPPGRDRRQPAVRGRARAPPRRDGRARPRCRRALACPGRPRGRRGADARSAAVLHTRVGRLDPEAQRVLEMASVAGREFDSAVIASALELDESAVLDHIEAASRASLVRERGVGHFQFAHALVQHALYDELGATRRSLHHRQLAAHARIQPRRDPRRRPRDALGRRRAEIPRRSPSGRDEPVTTPSPRSRPTTRSAGTPLRSTRSTTSAPTTGRGSAS